MALPVLEIPEEIPVADVAERLAEDDLSEMDEEEEEESEEEALQEPAVDERTLADVEVGRAEEPTGSDIGTLLRDIADRYEAETAEAHERMQLLQQRLAEVEQGKPKPEVAVRLQAARRTHTLLARMSTGQFREVRQAAQNASARYIDESF